jgi:hypothetical protein
MWIKLLWYLTICSFFFTPTKNYEGILAHKHVLLQKCLLVPVPNPLSPGCSNRDYEARTKDPRLLSWLLQLALKGPCR